MTKQEKVAAWMEGLGLEFIARKNHYPTSFKGYWVKPNGELPECSLDNEAAIFFYDVMVEARIDELQGLLDWQDQEADIDYRPVGQAYYVIQGGARESIEEALYHLKQEGKTNG